MALLSLLEILEHDKLIYPSFLPFLIFLNNFYNLNVNKKQIVFVVVVVVEMTLIRDNDENNVTSQEIIHLTLDLIHSIFDISSVSDLLEF